MEEIYSYVKRNKIVLVVLVLSGFLGGGYLLTHQSKPTPVQNELITTVKKTPNKKTNKVETDKSLVIDIQGAVKNPGVYHLKNGSIVQAALQMAGGLQSNADVKQINQAKKINDQMQIYVPAIGEKQGGNANGDNKSESKKVININTATADDFKDVSGIGPKKAEKIIAFREKNGNFQELHDLTKVSGIGEKSLESLKDQLTV